MNSSEKWRRKPTNPGQFPTLKKKPSDYAVQFREKQKVKRTYGMNETQFVRFYKLALKSQGNTSLRLLQMLELRADNVLYKLGFALTRAQARQMIAHGNVTLNGKKHNIPSTILKAGDEIEIKEKIVSSLHVKEITEKNKVNKVPTWLTLLEKGGKVVSEPVRDDIDKSIKERLIIELYSR